jgi:probable HAF family extracellular repeat protein
MNRYLLIVVLAATWLAPTGAVAAQSRYTITDLGTLGGDTSQAFGINDQGQVVGLANLNTQIYHAFFWDGKTMTDLGTLGGQLSSATDINGAGQVVGMSHVSGGKSRAFLQQNGVMQDLGTIGGDSSGASGINSAGQVVGWDSFTGVHSRAFLWQNGSMQLLGTFGGHSFAEDINDAGQVVGFSDYGPPTAQTHAFLWQNGAMQDLGHLGGDLSRAAAINETGQVVGSSDLIGARHAFLWQNGAMQDLGTLGGKFSDAYDINNNGQVVGYSTNSAGVGRAFLWENGQMKDLNTMIPADSGWGLVEARAINKKGQIVGYGVINGQTHAFLLTPRHPVLIVPGIAGTYSNNVLFDSGWLLQRGVHPNLLQVDPLGKVYHDLIQTFKNVGYVEGQDLFVVNYDWRLPPGPIDGVFDGVVSGLDAPTLSDDQFRYGVDYLGYYLRQAADAYRTANGRELDKVNVIAHSTGGLVARAYIQSGAYGEVYDAVNNYRLPTVDQFIMVGVPNRGASKAWNPLHDNWIADVAYRAVLSKIIDFAYQKVLAGRTILGPDYAITLASISVNGSPSPTLFIEKYVPTIRSLLATYDFIDFGMGFVTLNNDPAQRNNAVLDLNAGLDLVPTADPSPFAGLVNATTICGSGERTALLVADRTGTARNGVLLPFTDYLANDAGVSTVWYEDLWQASAGDQTVPLESCRDQFLGDGRVTVRLFSSGGNTSGRTDHTGLMSNPDVQKAILDTFAVKYQPADIATGTAMNYANIYIVSMINDPVGAILVDGAGRRLGYSQAEGPITEIPGSLWFGGYDGLGYVFGGLSQPLHLDLTGRGEDYYVMVAVERAGRPAGGAVSSGFLGAGEALTIPIVLKQLLFLPLILR